MASEIGGRNVAIIGSIVVAAAIAYWVFGQGSEPQLGNDEEVVRVTDALFTALTSKNESRLAHCENRLADLRDKGKLPEQAGKRIEQIVVDARGGNWEPAAKDLYRFIRGQKGLP